MNWHTVYDLSTADAHEYIGFVLFGAGMLVLAGGFLWRARRRGASVRPPRRWWPVSACWWRCWAMA